MSEAPKDPSSNIAMHLAYVDKEMTIMAALTAAAGGAFLYLAKELLSGSLASAAQSTLPFFIVGLAALGAATLAFYLQRSHMMWCYGEITLSLCGLRDLKAALRETDLYTFWLRYRLAFVIIGLAAAELFLAVLAKTEVISFGSAGYTWLSAIGLVIGALLIALQQLLKVRNRDRRRLMGNLGTR